MLSQGMKEFERKFRQDRQAWKGIENLLAERCDKCPAGSDCDSCDILPRLEKFNNRPL